MTNTADGHSESNPRGAVDSAVVVEAIELLLSAISTNPDEGLRSAFMFGKPGAASWDKRLGAELFYSPKGLNRATLFVRRHGAEHLRCLPIADIWSELQRFVSDQYWLISEDVWLKRFTTSYAEQVPAQAKQALAAELSMSRLFRPTASPTAFPLVTVQVTDDFECHRFALIKPASLGILSCLQHCDPRQIAPESFPPLTNWEGRKETPSSWLVVRSPAHQAAEKAKSAILGALSLTILARYRYSFSMRKTFGGRCTFGETCSMAFGDAHTPAIAHNVIITSGDHGWLAALALKLGDQDTKTLRQIKALEYLYRCWGMPPPERFPVLCMALDAIFGEAGGATQALVNGVRDTLGGNIDEKRLRLLVKLRASVIHGGAPDVYDSKKYADYYDAYGDDPIRDLELIVAESIRRKVFAGALHEHDDPNAAVIAAAQAKGRLPKILTRSSILDGLAAL